MFVQGRGEVQDLLSENGIANSGRGYIWLAILPQIQEKPWVGHGFNTASEFVLQMTGYSAHPHNDWLRIAYELGLPTVALYLLTIITQVLHCLKRARLAVGDTRLLLYSCASSFVVMACYMMTDNVILYAAFFGNLQFALMGYAYALLRGGTIRGTLKAGRSSLPYAKV